MARRVTGQQDGADIQERLDAQPGQIYSKFDDGSRGIILRSPRPHQWTTGRTSTLRTLSEAFTYLKLLVLSPLTSE